MVIIETAAFAKQRDALLPDDDSFRALQVELVLNPEAGYVMAGTHGVRKVRIGIGTHGKGRGARVLYYWAKAYDRILLLALYTKGEKEQLTKDQQHRLAEIVRKEFG